METIPYEILTIIAQESLEVYWKLCLAHLTFGLRARKNRGFWLLCFGVSSHNVKHYIEEGQLFVEKVIWIRSKCFRSTYRGKNLIGIYTENDTDKWESMDTSYRFDTKLGTLINIYRGYIGGGCSLSQVVTIEGENTTETRKTYEGNPLHNEHGAAVVKLQNNKIVEKSYFLKGEEWEFCACDDGTCGRLHIYNGYMRWGTDSLGMSEETILEDLKVITFVPKSVDEWIAKSWN